MNKTTKKSVCITFYLIICIILCIAINGAALARSIEEEVCEKAKNWRTEGRVRWDVEIKPKYNKMVDIVAGPSTMCTIGVNHHTISPSNPYRVSFKFCIYYSDPYINFQAGVNDPQANNCIIVKITETKLD